MNALREGICSRVAGIWSRASDDLIRIRMRGSDVIGSQRSFLLLGKRGRGLCVLCNCSNICIACYDARIIVMILEF